MFFVIVAATGLSLLQENMRRNLPCKEIVIFTKSIVPKQFFLNNIFCNNFGRDGIYSLHSRNEWPLRFAQPLGLPLAPLRPTAESSHWREAPSLRCSGCKEASVSWTKTSDIGRSRHSHYLLSSPNPQICQFSAEVLISRHFPSRPGSPQRSDSGGGILSSICCLGVQFGWTAVPLTQW